MICQTTRRFNIMSSPPPYHHFKIMEFPPLSPPPYESSSPVDGYSKDELAIYLENEIKKKEENDKKIKEQNAIMNPLNKRIHDEMRLLHSEDVTLIQKIVKKGETILFILTGDDEQANMKITIFAKIKSANGFRNDQETRRVRKMNMVITTHNVYRIRYHTDKTYQSTCCGRVFTNIYEPIHMAVYSFDEPLTIHQIKLLSYINNNTPSPLSNTPYTYKTPNGIRRYSIRDRLFDTYITTNEMRPDDDIVQQNDKDMVQSARNQFSSIIQLIPGSYKNGDWKQLDGLFGDLYYNEKTNTLSEFPCLNM
jgi:hypothetical protein